MRVYFLSYRRAALKLNGIYVGLIDGFERHIELNLDDEVFAEIIPENNAAGINFIIDNKFTIAPPDFCDVYLSDGEMFIHIKKFPPKDGALKVICQKRLFGCLYTVFSQGGVMLSCDGESAAITPLNDDFLTCGIEPVSIGGFSAAAIVGGGWLCLASTAGKVIFLNKVSSYTFGNSLDVTKKFETCTAAEACCSFSYNGEKLTLIKSVTTETREVNESILHFAFFESVLTCGDWEKYLCEELKDRAHKLKDYLGDFKGVTVPPESFYYRHGDIPAAGLVYSAADNLYKIKYFAVNLKDGKIENIYTVV